MSQIKNDKKNYTTRADLAGGNVDRKTETHLVERDYTIDKDGYAHWKPNRDILHLNLDEEKPHSKR